MVRKKGFTLIRTLLRKNLVNVQQGFTLIELLVVVAIIALLLILGFWAYSNQLSKGRDARRKTDIHRLQVAVEEYEKDKNCYPSSPDIVVCAPGTGLSPYLNKIACDPKTGASYYYDYDTSTTCSKWYRIFAKLENSSDPDYLANIGPGGAYSYEQSSPNALAPYLTLSDFYGCKEKVCVRLYYDSRRPGIECDPHYGDPNCSNQCSNPGSECKPWQ